jgi:hypothetical protein
MHCATESTITSILEDEDSFLDIASLFDVDGLCEQDPLFTFDLLESSDMMYGGGLPALDVISKDDVSSEETYFFPSKRRKSERKEFEFIMDESLLSRRATTNGNKSLPTKPSRGQKKIAPSPSTSTTTCSGSILSLLTPKQLEQQLKHTTNRLTDSMERSIKSRKRLNDQGNFQEYCPSQEALSNKHSHFSDNLFVHSSSVLSSQSRTNLILSQSRAQLASFKNASSYTF